MSPRSARAAIAALGLQLVNLSCTSDLALPDGFTFGTATAGFQADMGCPTIPAAECEDPNSDWYQFVTSTVTIGRGTNFLSGHSPSSGPGYYELYERDIELVAAQKLGSFRVSIEWSRVFPQSTIGVEGHEALKARASAPALDFYRRQLAAMRAKGIKPLVTLHHYTLPVWIHDAVGCNTDLSTCTRRGWLDERIVPEIAKYSGFVARELGAEIDQWATLNEPMMVVLFGFVQPRAARTNPPSVSLRLEEARTATRRMIEAHARMVDAVRDNDKADADGDGRAVDIGVVYAVAPIIPKDPENALDRVGAKNLMRIYTDTFLNGVLLGQLDDDLDGTPDPPRQDLVGKSDYLGVNYYFVIAVEGAAESAFPSFSKLLTFNPLTAEDRPNTPRGIYDGLVYVHEKYPGVPIIITENGADARTTAPSQEQFLLEHLQWTQRAIERGVDVRGYYWWSLMDNYEWNHGMSYQFGLFAVDPNDRMKTRTARPVAEVYRRIAEAGAIPKDLAERYPIPKE